ncbi:hypothetical protein [Bacillus salipaludis]|uniref:hypothetical protein n=1 Tax=Bacillus salipaludis TaxID=2547811 RepID=UPI002E1E2AE8|nr:hypothetical protein [Bacillus salipaludis]
MSENNNEKNIPSSEDNLKLRSLLNNALKNSSMLKDSKNPDQVLNLAGSLMKNPDTMSSILKMAADLFSNNSLKEAGESNQAETSQDSQQNPVNEKVESKSAEPAKEETNLSFLTEQLEKISNELSEIKLQLKDFKDHNKKLIEYILGSDESSKKG